jgi:hypothetical protein
MRRFAVRCPYFRDLHITNGLDVHHGVSRGARQHKGAASMITVDQTMYVPAMATACRWAVEWTLTDEGSSMTPSGRDGGWRYSKG